jgi:O-methyltransferase involved in polyketide biosynthesis
MSVAELGAVSETMLITLGCRAIETRRPDALLRDPRAAELVARLNYDRLKPAASHLASA